MTKGFIAVIGVGGTISMTHGPAGLTPTQSATDILRVVAAEHDGVAFQPIDLMRKASASMTLDDVYTLARALDDLAAQGAAGIVVTQGTDTLEEVAFAVELLSEAPIPIVFTGAMRGASALGYDGGANLADAIRVALYAKGRGEVFVVMNGEAHTPRWVTKAHTSSLAAFMSPSFGPLMNLHESKVHEVARIPRAPKIAVERPSAWPRVALIQLGLDDDCRLLPHLKTIGYEGCVLAAAGAGHVGDFAMDAIAQTVAHMPIVLCSRTGAGRICEQTYAYAGGEIDLLQRGVIPAKNLSPVKARLVLSLCAAMGPPNTGEAFVCIADALT
ncbi:MAG TPA: asparaginase [Verrucomicrobiae bacterium]|nr:asparaginase [Verrucomicrobiae bacterium]